MTTLVTVVVVEALSYSGTTWLNLVLGSHPRAFTLGPPWRVWGLREQGFRGANLVWGERDTFWSGFDRRWDRRQNFLVALAEHAGATHIVFDNPSPEFRAEVMSDPRIRIVPLRYVRDGRAISASFWRKNQALDYLDTILPAGWLYHSFMGFGTAARTMPVFHYEECLADPLAFLARIGPLIGLDYDVSALRFWEHDHHITWGNPGTIALLRMANGLGDDDFAGRDFYRRRFGELARDPVHGFRDDRWRDDLDLERRCLFDLVLGAGNAALGYPRDEFDAEAGRQLRHGIEARLATGAFAGLPPGSVEAYLANMGG